MKKETMLLKDAIKCAIEANKKIIIYKRIIGFLIISNIVAILIGVLA